MKPSNPLVSPAKSKKNAPSAEMRDMEGLPEINGATKTLEYQPSKNYLRADELQEGQQYKLKYAGVAKMKKKADQSEYEQLCFVDEYGDLWFVATWAVRNKVTLVAQKMYLLTAKMKKFVVVEI